MSGKINFEKSQEAQKKYGAGFYIVDNTTAGNEYVLLLNEMSGGEQGGSDIEDGDQDDEEDPLFKSEKDQKRYNQNKATVFQEVYKTGRKSSKSNFITLKGLKAKTKLRDLKTGGKKVPLEFVSKAMHMEPDELLRNMARNPRLKDNIQSLMNKPVSTLRRAFSPAGDEFTRDMLEDAGMKDTIDLIAAIITKFGE